MRLMYVLRSFSTMALALAVFIATAATTETWAGPLYRAKKLPIPPGFAFSTAVGINNVGQIVGYIGDGVGHFQGIVWFRGQFVVLDCPTSACITRAINDQRQVAVDVIGIGWGASLWNKGTLTPLAPSAAASNVFALNNRGQAVGVSTETPGGHFYATLWTKESTRLLPPLPGFENSSASPGGINNRGHIVGVSENIDANNDFHATIWINGEPFDLGVLDGYPRNQAVAINDANTIIGLSFPGSGRNIHATLWKHGQISDLGGLPGYTRSEPSALNNRGQIVGFSIVPTVPCLGVSVIHAVLWQEGAVFDLNELSSWDSNDGANICFVGATGINDDGDIIVNGVNILTNESSPYLLIRHEKHPGW
jgi:probable HAF family extracellular repeat protein